MRLDPALLIRAIGHEAASVAHLARVMPSSAEPHRERLAQLRAVTVSVGGSGQGIDVLNAEITAAMTQRNVKQTTALLLSLTGDTA